MPLMYLQGLIEYIFMPTARESAATPAAQRGCVQAQECFTGEAHVNMLTKTMLTCRSLVGVMFTMSIIIEHRNPWQSR